MSNLTRFSFIIPLYNKEKYIIYTLNSILQQSYKEYEVIIIDDGSSDNSFNVVEEFINKMNLTESFFLYSQENNGVSSARNNGILKAKYEFCVFLDADDVIIYVDYLNSAREIISKNSIDIIGYNFIPNKNNIPAKFDNKVIDYYELYVKYGPPFCASSVIIRRDICRGVFPENEWLGEDLYAWSTLIERGSKIYFKNTPAIEYIIDDCGAMKRKKEIIKIIRHNCKLNIDSRFFPEFIKHHKNDYLRSCIYFNDKTSAIKFLKHEPWNKFIFYRILLIFPMFILDIMKNLKKKVLL